MDLAAGYDLGISIESLLRFNDGAPVAIRDDESEIGADVGDDFEDEIDREMQAEGAFVDEESEHTPEATESEGSLFDGEDLEDDEDGVSNFGTGVDIRTMFPAFRPGATLNLTDLFTGPPRKKQRLSRHVARFDLPPLSSVPIGRSTRGSQAYSFQPPRSQVGVLLDQARSSMRPLAAAPQGEVVEASLAAIQQNSKRSWQLPSEAELSATAIDLETPADSRSAFALTGLPTHNPRFAQGQWTASIVWDDRVPFTDFTSLQLTEAEVVAVADAEAEARIARNKRTRHVADLDPLNLSNDKQYEVARERRQRIRQTLGTLEVQHAYPAIKLQLPFYKTKISKADARGFHRPSIALPVGIRVPFTRVRGAKRKKDKAGKKVTAPSELMHTSGDLSLRDSAPFILLEYSEETPMLMSNFGMGSVIANYYRRRDHENKDEQPPAMEIGETVVLEETDESPYKKFGEVAKGQMVTTLYNNLVRAPMFQHKPPSTDFVIVRNTVDGEVRYYIREIPHLFAVGQLFPQEEVPQPASRKITALMRNRLQIIAMRLCQRYGGRFRVPKIVRYFPGQTDLQMRQRLKDFMEFSRKQDSQGAWSIKTANPPPPESELRRLATPEQVVLAEATEAGQRYLTDAGFGKEVGAEEDENEPSNLSVERQLAPWTASKNFLLAQTTKAMLALYGEGDPTGRGEAFSFVRISMKSSFVRAADIGKPRIETDKKYTVANQNVVYREEVERIWNAQLRSLADPRAPQLTFEDEERAAARHASETPAATASPFPGATPGPDAEDGPSAGPSSGPTRITKNKIIKIQRFVNGQWQRETVRDPLVVAAYFQARRKFEDEEGIRANDITMTDDPERNERMRQKLLQEIERLQKKTERRQQREKVKAGLMTEQEVAYEKKGPKGETTRKCGSAYRLQSSLTILEIAIGAFSSADPPHTRRTHFAEFYPEKARKKAELESAKEAQRSDKAAQRAAKAGGKPKKPRASGSRAAPAFAPVYPPPVASTSSAPPTGIKLTLKRK